MLENKIHSFNIRNIKINEFCCHFRKFTDSTYETSSSMNFVVTSVCVLFLIEKRATLKNGSPLLRREERGVPSGISHPVNFWLKYPESRRLFQLEKLTFFNSISGIIRIYKFQMTLVLLFLQLSRIPYANLLPKYLYPEES